MRRESQRYAAKVAVDVRALQARHVLPPPVMAARSTEEFRRIKWPILDAVFRADGPLLPLANMVMLTSSIPGEGKTVTAINLALNIASERDSTVLLVDADLAKRHVSGIFGVEMRPGLTDLLVDSKLSLADVLVETSIEGLSILPAGGAHAQAPELLASRRMQALMQDMSNAQSDRIVLFDTPPLLARNEAQVLARLVGQVLLVVRADFTRQAAILEALALLDRTKTINCVLSQVDPSAGPNYYASYHPDENK